MTSLRVFESAARHLSFSSAARELNLTQSAVSLQIRTLEKLLKLKLFNRVQQRLTLTPAALAYLPRVRDVLSRVEAATLELLSHQGTGGVLNLAILPTFGTRWLIPRMPQFAQQYPQVTVNFFTKASGVDFASEPVDAAICFGEPSRWPGNCAQRLMGEEVVLICTPGLAEKQLKSLKDLATQTLLQHTTRPQAWQEWLAAVGAAEINGLKGPRFEHFHMVIQAAVAGLGVAVMPRFLVEKELNSGELVIPFNHAVSSSQAYYFVYPPARQELPALKLFRDWLVATAQSGQ